MRGESRFEAGYLGRPCLSQLTGFRTTNDGNKACEDEKKRTPKDKWVM